MPNKQDQRKHLLYWSYLLNRNEENQIKYRNVITSSNPFSDRKKAIPTKSY